MSQSIGCNLLAKILAEGRLADFYSVKRDYLYDAEPGIYDEIKKHVTEHGVLPTLDFFQRHHDLDAPDSEDPYGVWYTEYLSRALYNKFGDLLPEVQRHLARHESREALDKVTEFVTQADSIRTDGQTDLSTGVEFGQQVLEEFRRLRGMHGLSGVPSGWPTLDNTTHGFQNGDLILFAARPAVGKSTVAAKLTVEAHKAGHIPLLVSMEMKKVQIGARVLGMQAGVNMKILRTGQMTSFVEDRMQQALARIEQNPAPMYLIEGQFRKSVNDLSALVHSLHPSILIIDGAYLLKLPSAHARMPLWERMGEVAQILKSLAITCDIPVIGTFQINREGGKKDKSGKDTGVEHLQLSDALGQLASLVVGIFKDEDTDSSDEESHRRLKILKGREGERGEFHIHYNFATMTFDEINPPASHNDTPVWEEFDDASE